MCTHYEFLDLAVKQMISELGISAALGGMKGRMIRATKLAL